MVKKLDIAALVAAARAKKMELAEAAELTDVELPSAELEVIAKTAAKVITNMPDKEWFTLKSMEPEPSISMSPLDMLKSRLTQKSTPMPTGIRGMKADLIIVDEIAEEVEPDGTIHDVDPDDMGIDESALATGMHGEAITYNQYQLQFIDTIGAGNEVVLIGAAGTGKTTATQGGIKRLLDSGEIPILKTDGHKHLVPGTPGIIIISYTRRAVNNIRKVQSEEMKSNCITAHKLLEYRPEYYEVYDEVEEKYKNTMRFEPSRNASNPLPDSIHTIVVEEASMLSTDLYMELQDAIQHEVQWVFIGDIQQLPPVFGPAILGFKLNELEVIELTHVYRQALESPIIRLAHRILSGKPIPAEEYPDWHFQDQLTIHPWKKKLNEDNCVYTLAAFFKKALAEGVYDIEEDIILMPFNKAVGTIELNKHIANYLARQADATTFEVIAGYIKHYYSIGDKILYDREDAEVIDISANPAYSGARPQHSSKNLDYWGHNPKLIEESNAEQAEDLDTDVDIDFLLDQAASATEERVTQASHILVVQLADTMQTIELSKAAEINGLLHAYALTIHKAQGSEWRKVFVLFHWTHATMLQRELLYTAVTRAKEELYIICEPESFTKGIQSQRIKGETLAEKAEYFKGKQI